MYTLSNRKISAMQKEYGITKNKICKTCCNFVQGEYRDRTYRKCKAYGITNSEASDWVGKYKACGLYDKPFENEKKIPLIEVLKHSKKGIEDLPIEGQVTF